MEKAAPAIFLGLSLLLIAILGASLYFFLDSPDHRIGGIAWNALFQVFAPALAMLYGLAALVIACGIKTLRIPSLLAALALIIMAGYCYFRCMPMMMGI